MPDVSQLVTRIASALKINYADAAELAQRIVPVVVIDSIDGIGESADTATRWVQQAGENAGAANQALVALQNPVASGVRLLGRGFLITSDTTGTIKAAVQAGVLSAAATTRIGQFTDGQTGQPVGTVIGNDLAATVGFDINFNVIADTPFWIDAPYALSPGDQFAVQCNVTARVLRVSFNWREIKLPTVV